MKVGDIVWYKGKEYYLYSIYKCNLCRIVRIRHGKYTHTKNGEEHLNANIVNLDINEIKLYGGIQE
jgi:hypothetical protein